MWQIFNAPILTWGALELHAGEGVHGSSRTLFRGEHWEVVWEGLDSGSNWGQGGCGGLE